MNEINFLPQSYRQRLRTRQRRVREVSVVLILAAGMLVHWTYGLTGTMRLRQDTLVVENRLTNALGTEQRVAELTAAKDQLLEQRRVQRSVRVPVRHHEVIRVLGSLLPESAALESLSLVNHRPPPAPYRDPSLPDPKTADAENQKPKAAPKAEPDYIAVRIEGLAPDDLAVASVIASLSEHALFRGVKLHSSRFVETQGVAARRFHLTASVDLARDYRWVQSASTDPAPDDLDIVAEAAP